MSPVRWKVAISVELPLLAGEPRQHDALDRREVAGLQLHVLARHRAPRARCRRAGERIAVLRDAGAIAGTDLIDHGERQVAFVLLQVLQLRTKPAPATRSAAVHTQRAAHAIVGWRRVGEHPLELVDAGARSGAAQLEQLANVIVRLVRQHLGDGALVQRRHVVTAGVDRLEETLDLVGAGDRAVRELLQFQTDGCPLVDGEIPRRGRKGAIEPDSASLMARSWS